ncbi:hypothetical protein IHE27_02605 (plasmid) [Mycetohabitans endofungorum]
MLRLLKRNGQKYVTTTSTPTIVGVDDWAVKHAHRYGTLLVDIEQRRPLDRLPDRDIGGELTNRKPRNPHRVARLRWEGITRGAPQACSGLQPSIGHDYDAVHAARLTPYGNGIVEGHVNRLKFLKRPM